MKRKAIIGLSLFFFSLTLFVFIRDLFQDKFERWPDALGRLFFSLAPLFLFKLKKIPFSLILILNYYLFLLSTFFLGAVFKFYDRFPWWDTALHLAGGVFMGFIGRTIFHLFLTGQAEKHVSHWLGFLFVYSFSLASSVIWELAEFAGAAMGWMEGDSGTDIMMDLLAGFAGGLIPAVYESFYKKSKLLKQHK